MGRLRRPTPRGGCRCRGSRGGGGLQRALLPLLLGCALCAQPLLLLQGYLRASVSEWWGGWRHPEEAAQAPARPAVPWQGGLAAPVKARRVCGTLWGTYIALNPLLVVFVIQVTQMMSYFATRGRLQLAQ